MFNTAAIDALADLLESFPEAYEANEPLATIYTPIPDRAWWEVAGLGLARYEHDGRPVAILWDEAGGMTNEAALEELERILAEAD